MEGQKVHGTYKEQFSELNEKVTKAVQAGAATPEEYRATLIQLLKSTESLRMKNETEVVRLEKQIAHHQAVARSCSMFGAMLLHIVDARTRERLKIIEGQKLIDQRALDEDKRMIEEYRAQGRDDKADRLAAEVAKREAQVRGDAEVIPIGSAAEGEVIKTATSKAIVEDFKEASKQPATPPAVEIPTVRSTEDMVSEAVADGLKEVPVDQKEVLATLPEPSVAAPAPAPSKAEAARKKPARRTKKKL
jgi:hypothetical protein